MRITDLFKQDILNPKPILLKEYGGVLERKTSYNYEAILLVLLFGLTLIALTKKIKINGNNKKED